MQRKSNAAYCIKTNGTHAAECIKQRVHASQSKRRAHATDDIKGRAHTTVYTVQYILCTIVYSIYCVQTVRNIFGKFQKIPYTAEGSINPNFSKN